MEFILFYILFSWAVVYKVFEDEMDSEGERFTNLFMSLISGWIILPLLIGVHLRK